MGFLSRLFGGRRAAGGARIEAVPYPVNRTPTDRRKRGHRPGDFTTWGIAATLEDSGFAPLTNVGDGKLAGGFVVKFKDRGGKGYKVHATGMGQDRAPMIDDMATALKAAGYVIRKSAYQGGFPLIYVNGRVERAVAD